MNAPLPTALPDIHAFLVQQGAGLEPWRPAGQKVDALLALLDARQHDPVFWSRLSVLCARLESDAVRLDQLPEADGLLPADRARLMRALREALQEDRRQPRLVIGGNLRALAGFLMLGMAVACGDKSDDTAEESASEDGGGVGGDGADGGEVTSCDQAEALGYSGDEGAVYCALLEVIDGATELSQEARSQLEECFPELSAARRAALLEAFQSAGDEELLSLLYELAYSEECGWVDDGGH